MRSEEDLVKVTVRSEISTWRVVMAVTFGILYEEKNFWIVKPTVLVSAGPQSTPFHGG